MKEQVGRLAFRVEGDFWVAYHAKIGTMEDAVVLGSIRMQFVQDECTKQMFMAMMRDAVAAILKEITGTEASWPEPNGRPAPQHERAGRA